MNKKGAVFLCFNLLREKGIHDPVSGHGGEQEGKGDGRRGIRGIHIFLWKVCLMDSSGRECLIQNRKIQDTVEAKHAVIFFQETVCLQIPAASFVIEA